MGYRQAVRHKTLTLACDSSNLSTPANGGYSSVGRAPDCGSGCRRFESCYPPHINFTLSSVIFFIFILIITDSNHGSPCRARPHWRAPEITLKQQAVVVS